MCLKPMLHTFQELEKDALAVGLLKKMKTVKFLGSIYILKEVVPCLTTLSKTFQAGALNFSHVGLAINHTQASLEAVKSSQSPLKKLQDYIKPEGRLGGLEMIITDNDKKILGNLKSKVRVLYDAAARFEGTALNKELLQGPLLNNTLVAVLMQFRKDEVAKASDA